jgi:hypothetical protein
VLRDKGDGNLSNLNLGETGSHNSTFLVSALYQDGFNIRKAPLALTDALSQVRKEAITSTYGRLQVPSNHPSLLTNSIPKPASSVAITNGEEENSRPLNHAVQAITKTTEGRTTNTTPPLKQANVPAPCPKPAAPAPNTGQIAFSSNSIRSNNVAQTGSHNNTINQTKSPIGRPIHQTKSPIGRPIHHSRSNIQGHGGIQSSGTGALVQLSATGQANGASHNVRSIVQPNPSSKLNGNAAGVGSAINGNSRGVTSPNGTGTVHNMAERALTSTHGQPASNSPLSFSSKTAAHSSGTSSNASLYNITALQNSTEACVSDNCPPNFPYASGREQVSRSTTSPHASANSSGGGGIGIAKFQKSTGDYNKARPGQVHHAAQSSVQPLQDMTNRSNNDTSRFNNGGNNKRLSGELYSPNSAPQNTKRQAIQNPYQTNASSRTTNPY